VPDEEKAHETQAIRDDVVLRWQDAGVTTLEILHWNDVHGRYEGLGRLAARARTIRAEADHPVLLLDGGDVEESSVRLSALSHGVAGWRLLGAAGVDAAVLGNGGLLRYGPSVLPRYAAALGSAPLVCDLELDGAAPPGAAGSTLIEAGGITVGVLGTTDFYPQYTDGFGLTERGRVTAVRSEAVALRRAGAQVVIQLSHCGLDADAALAWNQRGYLDLVVSGHSHDPLPEGRDTGLPTVHAGCYAQYLGRVLLEVGADGVTVTSMLLEEVPDDAPGDPAVLAELAAAERDVAEWMAEPVGRLDRAIGWTDDGDSEVAALMAEALLDHHPGDVGVVVAAHMEAGLAAGEVTRGDVYAATSSPGNPATATLTGAELRAMLLRGVSDDYASQTPRTFRGRRFGRLHVVGAVVDGDRVDVGSRPLDDSARYRVSGSDLELSRYGGLLDRDPDDLVLDASVIFPEVLERFLSSR